MSNNSTNSDSEVNDDAVAQAAEALAGTAGVDALAEGGGDAEFLKLQQERDQFFENWKRTLAELDNFRRRVSRDAEQSARFAAQPLICDLLPSFDNLTRTIQAAEQSGNIDNLLTGLKMVMKQLEEVLTKFHAKPIECVGQAFDPNIHSALTQVPTAEHPPMTVLQEVERGYMMHDRVVRPSKVIVSCAPPA